MIDAVGVVKFDNISIDVYGSLDDPLFKLIEVVDAIDIPEEKFWDVVSMCEGDDVVVLPKTIDDDGFSRIYVTESGLYSILAQSRELIARKWRRVIIKELIDLRKSRDMDISEQFDEWDHMLDDIYFDEDTGVLMQSILTQGGDVMQVPFGSDESEDVDGII